MYTLLAAQIVPLERARVGQKLRKLSSVLYGLSRELYFSDKEDQKDLGKACNPTKPFVSVVIPEHIIKVEVLQTSTKPKRRVV